MAISTGQPYKFTGKELNMGNGLNLYDFEARTYDPSVGRLTSIDPLAEKYYSVSPYAYCFNNPVNAVDLHGDTITTVVNTTVTNADGTTSIQSNIYENSLWNRCIFRSAYWIRKHPYYLCKWEKFILSRRLHKKHNNN
jgi:RHS repeat-associated protein